MLKSSWVGSSSGAEAVWQPAFDRKPSTPRGGEGGGVGDYVLGSKLP